jgi:hypothetical protein
MDINQLLHREGEERLRAAQAESEEARAAHTGLADLYRSRIASSRRKARAPGASPRHDPAVS